jgi:hypothetical protein
MEWMESYVEQNAYLYKILRVARYKKRAPPNPTSYRSVQAHSERGRVSRPRVPRGRNSQ